MRKYFGLQGDAAFLLDPYMAPNQRLRLRDVMPPNQRLRLPNIKDLFEGMKDHA